MDREEQAAWEARTEAAPGLTIAEARRWFDEVQNRENWKFPVDHSFQCISAIDRAKVSAAIVHFTGSVATWQQKGSLGWRVQAAGYYSAVGA